MNKKRVTQNPKKKAAQRKPIVKKVVSKPLENSDVTSNQQERKFTNNRFTFTGVFSKFKEKRNGYGDILYGFIMKDITNFKTKKLFVESQWFNLGEGFKEAFESYSDKQLIGKIIKFDGFKVTEKKGYFEYRNNALISEPNDLEYRVLRPTKIKVI